MACWNICQTCWLYHQEKRDSDFRVYTLYRHYSRVVQVLNKVLPPAELSLVLYCFLNIYVYNVYVWLRVCK